MSKRKKEERGRFTRQRKRSGQFPLVRSRAFYFEVLPRCTID